MLVAVADTHALVWYIFNDSRLSLNARNVFEEATDAENSVGFSSISVAELVYLQEKRRIHPAVLQRMLPAVDRTDSVLVELPVDRNVALSLQDVPRDQVSDLPDRVISATAVWHGVSLITRDHRIVTSGISTIW